MFAEIFAPITHGKWSKAIRIAALVMAISTLLISLIATPISWYKDIKLSKAQSSRENISVAVTAKNLDLINELPKQHLFGSAIHSSNTNNLPITNLQLSLIGIIQSQPESKSSVIISSAGQPGKVYFIGDKISETLEVGAITKDGVILENNGRLEKLPLKRQKLAFKKLAKKLLLED